MRCRTYSKTTSAVVGSRPPARLRAHNPATGELVAVSTKSTPADVDAAVAAAKTAFASWRLYPAPKRGELLFKVARVLEDRKEELAREMTEEMGKVIDEARGDVQEAHRHDLLHGRRGPPHVRPDHPLRAAQQVPDVGPQAPRRLRHHHALELPDGDPHPGR